MILLGIFKNAGSIKGKEDTLTGVPSGFTTLNRVTNGWQNQI
jgi:replicative DNA helicase